MILEKNKEIQYMNTRLTFVRGVSDSHQIKDLGSLLMRSIVLEIWYSISVDTNHKYMI